MLLGVKKNKGFMIHTTPSTVKQNAVNIHTSIKYCHKHQSS